MNEARLLAHYDRVADAPDAIERLRRFILDLAVRGKLVPQDPNDESVAELFSRISLDKARLITAGKVTKQDVEAVALDKTPFETPNEWTWIRIGAAAYVEMGQSPPSEYYNQHAEGMPFFQGKADFGERKPTARYWCTQPTKLAKPGDILISVRAPVGPTNVADQECCIGRGLAALRPYVGVEQEFLLRCLQAFESDLASLGFGTTFVAINKKQLMSYQLPLPPLKEQRRIVAKVAELMGLCDQLEATRAEREATRDRLAAASLARLNSPDSKAFQDDARFVLDALPRFTTRPDQIKQIRQTILNLAVRGKLVPQDLMDEPTLKLLERRRIVAVDKGPFELPQSWAWVNVEAVAEARLGKMLDKAKNKGTPRRYLRNINVRWFDFDLSNLFEMRFEDSELSEFALRSGDVLICEGGEPGRAAVWDDREKGIYFQKAIHRVRFPNDVDPYYFVFALRASANDGRLGASFTGTGIQHFTGRGLDAYLFPLPPMAEQQRIVAKVDELMELCDRLESSLIGTAATRRRLLDALLAEVLAPDKGLAA